MNTKLRLAVLLSGTGRSLQNLIDRIAAGRLPAEIACVVSDRADAGGLDRARAAGLPADVFARRDFISATERDDAIFRHCRDHGIGLVCLAGYLQFLHIPEDFRLRVMNIHPALLPAFGGKGMYGHRVHQAVLDSGAKVTGCTVHFADDRYDKGPIILQRTAPVLDDDTADTLAARVFEQECEAYPEAIGLFAAGRLRIEGGRVRIRPA